MSVALYTIGHGDRDIGELIALLNQCGISTLVDIRSHPESSRYPWFSQDALRTSVESSGMVYHWAGRQLGGLRKAATDSIHTSLPDGLQGFADYMATPEFERAAMQLQRLAGQGPTALLCAERDPQYCHRSLIADYLLLNGNEVKHILDFDTVAHHQLRVEARRESAALIYDAAV